MKDIDSCFYGHDGIMWGCGFCMARLRYITNKEIK